MISSYRWEKLQNIPQQGIELLQEFQKKNKYTPSPYSTWLVSLYSVARKDLGRCFSRRFRCLYEILKNDAIGVGTSSQIFSCHRVDRDTISWLTRGTSQTPSSKPCNWKGAPLCAIDWMKPAARFPWVALVCAPCHEYYRRIRHRGRLPPLHAWWLERSLRLQIRDGAIIALRVVLSFPGLALLI